VAEHGEVDHDPPLGGVGRRQHQALAVDHGHATQERQVHEGLRHRADDLGAVGFDVAFEQVSHGGGGQRRGIDAARGMVGKDPGHQHRLLLHPRVVGEVVDPGQGRQRQYQQAADHGPDHRHQAVRGHATCR